MLTPVLRVEWNGAQSYPQETYGQFIKCLTEQAELSLDYKR